MKPVITDVCYCGFRIATGHGNRLNTNYCSVYCIELELAYGDKAHSMKRKKPPLTIYCELCEGPMEIRYTTGNKSVVNRTFCGQECHRAGNKLCKRNDMNRMRILRIIKYNDGISSQDISRILGTTSIERYGTDKVAQLMRTMKKWVTQDENKKFRLKYDMWTKGLLKTVVNRHVKPKPLDDTR